MSEHPGILILGCGYLGTQLIRIAGGPYAHIDALTRNSATCEFLRTLSTRQILQFELPDPAWHRCLNPADYRAIVLCVGSAESNPEGYRESYLDGANSVVEWLSDSFGGRLIYTSSISVYGDAGGSWIDEETTPAPESWRGEIILESEQILHHALPDQTLILRLGGLYGPERSRFLSAGAQTTDPSQDHYLNLIHVEDAAKALVQAIRQPKVKSQLYNLTDNHPVKRSELHAFLRSHYPSTHEKSPAEETSKRRRHSANRRVNSSRISQDLDWQPEYPHVFNAIPFLV